MQFDNLKGVIPAFMTGFTDDLTALDENRIQKHTRFLADSGVNGLYVGGSSGEMLLCSTQERKKLLETVIGEFRGQGCVIAHVGCTGTADTLELSRHAKQAGADAVSSVTPLYFAYTFPEVKQYYADIAAASDLPVIIYNIPARTGMALNADQLHELLLIPGVAGMKFTASDFFQLERLISEHPGQVFYNGSDEMLLSGLAARAHGGIGTTYNVMPDVFLQIRRLFLENRIAEAQAAQSTANRVIQALLKVGVIQGVKEMLAMSGLDYGQCRKPFLPLTQEAKQYLYENAWLPLQQWRQSQG